MQATQTTQVMLHNVRRSPAFTRRIEQKCAQLERFHPKITHCRVLVSKPEARATRGGAWVATIRVGIPGRELVVNHPHSSDVNIAVREAFAAMRRQLKDAASVGRGETRFHSRPVTGEAP